MWRVACVLIAAVLYGCYFFVSDMIVRAQPSLLATAPDFQDKKVWKPAKDHIFVNFEDGIPWSMEYFYVSIDDALVMGMELALVWALDTPVYQAWGPADAPRQRLFRRGSGWTAPMNGAKLESIPRVDWPAHRAIGATLLVYEGDAARPSAWETFSDPALESDAEFVAKRNL